MTGITFSRIFAKNPPSRPVAQVFRPEALPFSVGFVNAGPGAFCPLTCGPHREESVDKLAVLDCLMRERQAVV